jgi:hypothetical protein
MYLSTALNICKIKILRIQETFLTYRTKTKSNYIHVRYNSSIIVNLCFDQLELDGCLTLLMDIPSYQNTSYDNLNITSLNVQK